ncbi:hypothetical protein L210DRAFT_3565124 [Boletus edulis BED1]|uniref:Uncharacterized protein n=1 Tax=Boletus edulis BED1 TaxID=1328754 RepID=A0AAD4BGM8_BOLED|nr:hypothetical protein L210DRAFT_3565124 [Boletus edulis BED1]
MDGRELELARLLCQITPVALDDPLPLTSRLKFLSVAVNGLGRWWYPTRFGSRVMPQLSLPRVHHQSIWQKAPLS